MLPASQTITPMQIKTPLAAIKAGYNFFPFQREEIAFMVNSPSLHQYSADSMGLGKSVIALGFANAISAHRLLVVSPAGLRLNWLGKSSIWYDLAKNSGYAILSGEDLYKIERKLVMDKGYMPSPLFVSYDMIAKNDRLFNYLRSRTWDLMVLDEASAIRNIEAKRTRRVLTMWADTKNVKRVLAMDGTPMKNSAKDLFPPLFMMVPGLEYMPTQDRELCANFDDFTDFFTFVYNGQYGTVYKGARNPEHLRDMLRVRGQFFSRHLKKDVMKDLPEKNYERVDLDLTVKADPNDFATAAAVDRFLKAVENDDDEFINGNKKCFGVLRRQLGEAKAASKEALELVSGVLDAGEPVILYFYHHSVRDALIKQYQKAYPDLKIVVHDGTISPLQKQKNIDAFQRGEASILLAQVEAAVGYDAFVASYGFYYEYAYLPGVNEQAIDRMHRYGQKNAVNGYYLVADNAFDRELVKNFIKKHKAINKVIGDE